MEEQQPNFIPNQPKSLIHPDKVLTWVILVIAILLILGNVALYYVRLSFIEYGGTVTRKANERVQNIRQADTPLSPSDQQDE